MTEAITGVVAFIACGLVLFAIAISIDGGLW